MSLSGLVIFSKEVFINSVIGSLETRFKDLRDAENIVRATRIADLRSWPVTWVDLKGLHKSLFKKKIVFRFSF